MNRFPLPKPITVLQTIFIAFALTATDADKLPPCLVAWSACVCACVCVQGRIKVWAS